MSYRHFSPHTLDCGKGNLMISRPEPRKPERVLWTECRSMGTLSILNAPESLVDISLLKGGRRTQCPARKSCTAAIVASQPVAGVRHDEFLHVRRRVAHDDRHVGADSQPCNY